MGTGLLSEPFPRVGGVVTAEQVPLLSIAESVGTPVYVYSTAAIRAQYLALDAALARVPHRILYSVKANGNLAVLGLLKSLGAGVDIVSGGELFRARRAGFEGSDIVFSGVGKTAGEIAEALSAGVRMINAESDDEIDVINGQAARLDAVAPVALRVNPEVEVTTPHPYTRTGERGTKFGVAFDEAVAIAERLKAMRHVRLVGLDMHLGSQIAGTEPYVLGVERLLALYRELLARGFQDIAYLDVGGGLAVSYNDETPTDVDAFARVVSGAVAGTNLTLLVEPGRYIVANAGVLLTRVLYHKESGGKTYVVTDAGMNDLLRPSHYSAFHRIEPVARCAGSRETVDVVGPVCETGDFFALSRELAEVGAGDVLAIHSAGAYGFSMASNYNARPRAAEVLVDGSRFAVVTTRETYDDLVRHELSTVAWRDS
jgi:diaminopimelate decarboxylase